MNKELDDYILVEREFLHDISNHLVVISGMTSFVQSKLEKVDGIDPKYIEKLGKAVRASEKLSHAVIERRSKIKAIDTN